MITKVDRIVYKSSIHVSKVSKIIYSLFLRGLSRQRLSPSPSPGTAYGREVAINFRYYASSIYLAEASEIVFRVLFVTSFNLIILVQWRPAHHGFQEFYECAWAQFI